MPTPPNRTTNTGTGSDREARREFLKNVGKASATVPAVTLLLAASEKSTFAQAPPSGGSGSS